jgi:hypothetical protein
MRVKTLEGLHCVETLPGHSLCGIVGADVVAFSNGDKFIALMTCGSKNNSSGSFMRPGTHYAGEPDF